jgi:hypothetical protein
MNFDKDDPNNHVPAVTPDDDWDGLDVNQVFESQLPPRRSDLPKVPRADVSLSGFKAIESTRASTAVVSTENKQLGNSALNMNVNAERFVKEKDDFQAAHVMDQVTLGDDSKSNGQVSGMRGHLASGERDDWGVHHKKSSSRWMFYMAIGVILLISLTVFLSQFAGKKSIRESDKSGLSQLVPVEVPKVEDEDLGLLGELFNSDEDAIQMYGDFASEENSGDFLKFIYLSERNAPLVQKQWKPLGASREWSPSDKLIWNTYQDDETVYAELRGVNHDFSKFLAFFRFENADLKMDWKATTGYGTASFSELKMGEGDGSEVRGWISISDFFTQQLPDDRYHSFLMTSPKKEVSVWIYTEIGSEVDKDILALFTASPITGEYQSEARVILNLERGEQEILPSQWMIKSLIAENWLDQATP